MATIRGFKALRPTPDLAKEVSSVPYDVIYVDEVREEIQRNPHSFLRVTRPDGEYKSNESPSEQELLETARVNLSEMIATGVFVQDQDDSIYVYRLSSGSHSQTGIVACCSVEEYESEIIKRHEKTRPDKVEDRTRHLLALEAQTGLVFLAFRDNQTVSRLIAETINDQPLYDLTAPDGVRHTIWRVSKPGEFISAFKSVPEIYIADGHHRVESARLAKTKLSESSAHHSGDEEYNYLIAGIFPSSDLKILPYNRAVKDLNTLSGEQFWQKVEANFIVVASGEKNPKTKGNICVYFEGAWKTISPKVKTDTDPINSLDVSLLQNTILSPILGIHDPRTDERIQFIGGARGTVELERLVDTGTCAIAFSMFPTTMEELFAVSDIGEIMPPKSTWFEPKLRDGLLIHSIK